MNGNGIEKEFEQNLASFPRQSEHMSENLQNRFFTVQVLKSSFNLFFQISIYFFITVFNDE